MHKQDNSLSQSSAHYDEQTQLIIKDLYILGTSLFISVSLLSKIKKPSYACVVLKFENRKEKHAHILYNKKTRIFSFSRFKSLPAALRVSQPIK